MLQKTDTPAQWATTLTDRRINTVVVGPGNGISDATRKCVIAALATDKQCVLDADALSCWQDAVDHEQLMLALNHCSATVVLTPHAGEFQRLFGTLSAESFPSKFTSDT